jgi:glycosyltransferase involved in cell wall biosynthesis
MKPFFESPPRRDAARRLLLVSYSFPPDSSIGALRWEKLITYAAGLGWATDVLMMDPAQAAVRDDSRLSALPAGTRLFGIPLEDHPWLVRERALRRWLAGARNAGDGAQPAPAAGIARPAAKVAPSGLRGWVRGLRRAQLARLDHAQWMQWADRAAAVGAELARDREYDFVASSGPPQMAHEAARQIAGAADIPLVLDFRDPWAIDVHDAPGDLKSDTWLRLSRHAEARCLAAATLIVANTEAAARMFARRFPQYEDRIITVMNGADADVKPSAQWDQHFTIFQGGGLYDGRDPRLLFRAVANVTKSLGLSPHDLRVHFLGSTSYEGYPVDAIAAEEGISGFFVGEGMRPRRDALEAMRRAAMLVLLPQNEHHCIPGKTFEYVQASAWLLALAPAESATELLLRGSSALVVEPHEVEQIAAAIRRCYEAFSRGERPVSVNADGRYDRTRHAARLFEELTRRSRRPAVRPEAGLRA